MTRRVYLHLGVPTAGTPRLQAALWRGRERLALDGVSYPLRHRLEHIDAAADLCRARSAKRLRPKGPDAWDRVAARVRTSDASTAVISSAQLAPADAAAAARAAASFPGHEVHAVLTACDIATSVVAGWQTQVRHRADESLDAFVAGCLGLAGADAAAQRLGSAYWRLHDLPAIVDRWAAALSADRVHLVTAPAGAGSVDLLWRRFAAVVGVAPAIAEGDDAAPDTSLDAAATELLRRVNTAGAADIADPNYGRVVRTMLADTALAGGDGPRPVLPQRSADPARERARDMVRSLRGRGLDVVGDLDDLVPDADRLAATDATTVDADALAAASVRAVAGLVSELGPLERRLRPSQAAAQPPRAPAGAGGRGRRTRAAAEGVEPGPVYLHIGAPKTGTTFVQDIMWHNRDRMAKAGVLFTRRGYEDHFRATLDLRQIAGRTGASVGAWDRVVADSRGWAGTSVISHELFAGARARHVERAVESLGADRLHVVYSARDLWGLLSAEWQEATKHGNVLCFEDYLADVLDHAHDGVVGDWFWLVHDAVDVLARWRAHLPAERVHVVTVSPAGADHASLWLRFADLFGVDPRVVDVSLARSNPSLGGHEVTYLRHVNRLLGGRNGTLTPGQYSLQVKELLAQTVLAARRGKQRFVPPIERFEPVRERAVGIVEGLRAADYPVHGGLEELVPQRPDGAGPNPDATTPDELVEVGLDAVTGLVAAAVRTWVDHDKRRQREEARRQRPVLSLPGRVARRVRAAAIARTGVGQSR